MPGFGVREVALQLATAVSLLFDSATAGALLRLLDMKPSIAAMRSMSGRSATICRSQTRGGRQRKSVCAQQCQTRFHARVSIIDIVHSNQK
jgi:hypothetical protein